MLLKNGSLFIGLLLAAPAMAGPCVPEKIAELTRPASLSEPTARLDCEATLRPTDTITKRILIEGSASSGAVLDCNGATIDGRPGTVNAGQPMINILSRKDGAQWTRPENVKIIGCSLNGNARLYGMIVDFPSLLASSRMPGHTERAQAAAPRNVEFRNMKFIGSDGNMLFIGIGSTQVSVLDSSFSGSAGAKGSAIYLEAESADNVIRGNQFDVATGNRETIAIDGSARNEISNNVFRRTSNGSIFLYRNCGEAGLIRHQTPTRNSITGNKFIPGSAFDNLLTPIIHVSSRDGFRTYCGDDRGYNLGSSIDNGSHAIANTVASNEFVDRNPNSVIRVSETPNNVFGNRTAINSPTPAPAPAPTSAGGCRLEINAKNRLVVRAPDGRGLAYFAPYERPAAQLALRSFTALGKCR